MAVTDHGLRVKLNRVKHPHPCGLCGMLYRTEDEAYECCQGSLDDPCDRDVMTPKQLERMAEMFNNGAGMETAKNELHVSDYKIRPYWHKLRDKLMAREGMKHTGHYHAWRKKRIKELTLKGSEA